MEFEQRGTEKHPSREQEITHADPEQLQKLTTVALYEAIAQDDALRVKDLLAHNTHQTNLQEISLLDLAVMRQESNGHNEIVLLLLTAETKLSTKQEAPCLQKLLEKAIKNKNLTLVEHIANAGFKVTNIHNLEIAVRYKSNEIVRFLMNNGVSLNDKNDKGATPLHIAVAYGNVEAVKHLLTLGAPLLEPNAEQKTIFHIVEDILNKPRLTAHGRNSYQQIFKLCKDHFTTQSAPEIDDITLIINRITPLLVTSLPAAPIVDFYTSKETTPVSSWAIYVDPESNTEPITWFNRRTRYAAITFGGVLGLFYGYYSIVDYLSRHDALE
jgi:hypothetical protein